MCVGIHSRSSSCVWEFTVGVVLSSACVCKGARAQATILDRCFVFSREYYWRGVDITCVGRRRGRLAGASGTLRRPSGLEHS